MSDSSNVQESRKRVRDNNEDMELVMTVVGFIMVVVGAWYGQKYRVREITWDESKRAQKRAIWMEDLRNDRICREQLRFDIRCFDKLCSILQSRGGLKTTRYVTVKEIVALFLHILAHDLKNRTMQSIFARSGETVSRQFHVVLEAVLKIGKYYIKPVSHTTNCSRDDKWKWFEGVVGALDGTHIKMTVPIEDRPRYRDRKGDISTNVLATCDPNLIFTYVLPGWEGSASDPRVLRDALRRPNGLKVPINRYFLVDLGYTNGESFLAPYKGTRYHLNLWRGNTPTNYKELFNLRHSSARNTIERAFGLLKKRWSIIRDPSFYGKKTQVKIMNACFILHNFLREEKLEEESLLQEVDQDLLNAEGIDEEQQEDYIMAIRSSHEWNEFRDDLARKLFADYQRRRRAHHAT
ncbi:protein ALP1-like [Beta vulgaris subsp. vulgaris]|uniref:protein ALP1-like n=1 Tax=Beta vulgaris subsp. vulgaris TaxID=3555 RepID=UPI00053F49B7|nr:protein ALP1-like [Beta vulgaris subsp. vulgaris]